jgi:thiamine-monophosphate kinase
MKLKELELINFIKKLVGGKSIGNDCGFLSFSSGKNLLFTCDSLVEEVHFKSGWFTPFNLGRKAALINLSDIAGMGGRPLACLVSLGLSKETSSSKFINPFYKGLLKEFKKYNVKVLGGNLTKSKNLFIDIFLLGEVNSKHMVLRSGAKPGNLLLTTGFLGEARLGLKMLKAGIKDKKGKILKKFFLPSSRIELGQALAEKNLATSMMDISDGLSGDLLKLCSASRVGAELYFNKLPVSLESKRAAKKLGVDVLTAALKGGEDYELLFTCKRKNLKKIKQVSKRLGIKTSVIGRIKPLGFGKMIRKDNKLKPLKSKSWDHFS